MIVKGHVRNPYNYDRNILSAVTGLECPKEEGMTQQQFKDEVDINTIVKRFNLTGQMPTGVRLPTYGDFTGVDDYHSAMNALREAEQAFMAFPAELRDKFSNDPQKFLEYVEDESKLEESYELGIRQRPPEQPRDVVQAVDELAAQLKPAEPPK